MKPGAQTLLRALAGTVVPPVSPIKASSAQPDISYTVFAIYICALKSYFCQLWDDLATVRMIETKKRNRSCH